MQPDERDMEKARKIISRYTNYRGRVRVNARTLEKEYAAALAEEREETGRVIGERVAWLDSERRNGGDFAHFTARIEEAQYLAKKLRIAAAIRAGSKP